MKTIQLSGYRGDTAIRAGDFELLPSYPTIPIITSQPIANFNQYSWVQAIQPNKTRPIFQRLKINNGIIRMIAGTSFELSLKALDPSNPSDPNNYENLSFKWNRNGHQLYDVNKLNNETGASGFRIRSQFSKPDLSGIYSCEVSNEHGTTTSDSVELEIVDLETHPKFYKSLLLNGDGDGGLDGWQANGGIVTSTFGETLSQRNFGSFRQAGFQNFKYVERVDNPKPSTISPEFRFTKGGNNTLFFDMFWKDYNGGSQLLEGWRKWVLSTHPPQIIANEDYQKSDFGGFFPGPKWLDLYNKNDKLIGLYEEMLGYDLTYFTRDKIKFEKFGGTQTATMTQTVDVTDIADYVDGNVYGVRYVTSHLFAYVGAGITNYKIRVQTDEGEKTFNYYVGDSEDVFKRIAGNPAVRDKTGHNYYPNSNSPFNIESARLQILPNSDIEIIPVVDDQTDIVLEYLDENGILLKTETIKGPTDVDVWAIKEKVYFPLTLYPLFEFVRPNGENKIKVFGQTYTTTKALEPMFNKTTPNGKIGLLADNASSAEIEKLQDVNAKFLLKNYTFDKILIAYPPDEGGVWYGTDVQYRKHKAVMDHGAAAMFGVSSNIIIPSRTRSIRTTVVFTHKSEVIKDNDPELKSWDSQEIYSNQYGQNTGISRRVVEYGNPRCGITKMKMVLQPNDPQISDQHVSYNLPPADATVLGMQKALYGVMDAFNTVEINGKTFNYKLVMPDGLPDPPKEMTNIQITTALYKQSEYDNVIGGIVASNAADANRTASEDSGNMVDPDTDLTDTNLQFELLESIDGMELGSTIEAGFSSDALNLPTGTRRK